VAAIEFATGRRAYVVGKPAHGFFDGVLAELGIRASAAAMIGDDVESESAERYNLASPRSRTNRQVPPGAVARIRCATDRLANSIADVPRPVDH